MSFQGWSDAGSAATTATSHLIDVAKLDLLHTVSAEGYVDLQMYRPAITTDNDGNRIIEWPDSKLYGPGERSHEAPIRSIDEIPAPEIYVFEATEPSHLWQTYLEEVLDIVDAWDFDLVVSIGAMFSDAPHSRPIPITLTSEQDDIRADFDALKPNYEGPVGITTIINYELLAADVPTLSLWAQIPHYVHSSPSPKATLAILDRLEEVLNIIIPRGNLLEEATQWEQNISTIASQDAEMSNYIQKLEEARDSVDGPQTTGEAIANELEKFLRKEPFGFKADGQNLFAPGSAEGSSTETDKQKDQDPDEKQDPDLKNED